MVILTTIMVTTSRQCQFFWLVDAFRQQICLFTTNRCPCIRAASEDISAVREKTDSDGQSKVIVPCVTYFAYSSFVPDLKSFDI